MYDGFQASAQVGKLTSVRSICLVSQGRAEVGSIHFLKDRELCSTDHGLALPYHTLGKLSLRQDVDTVIVITLLAK
jgi:hypothetical protein